ncbi:MmcQ/YjbR family DNA-binding protein [Kitasatospora sp. NPDC088134]|uniref:MmcQ/YjbR family DNA-binding protein n=1 Tax=Kitasatospora sp. NPDC088134 TaxID=3364071 RepID=UPI003801DC39
MAVTVEEVRALARTLPRSTEALVRDRVKFRVGRIVYLAFSRDETVLGFAHPKEERAALVAAEPAKFLPPEPADERFHWAQVRTGAIDAAEMRELVLDAWRMVVPKRVAAEYARQCEAQAGAAAIAAPALADLAAAAEVFNGFPGVDRSWLALRELTGPAPDPGSAAHRRALLRWLNSWGCRIRYPREGEPDLFDTGLADWWTAWADRLPAPGPGLAELDDTAIRRLAHAYADLAAVPVAAGRSARTLGPTAAAKTLYALRPAAVMPWDAAIAEHLHGARDADAFARHLTLGRTWARAVLAEARTAGAPADGGTSVPELVGRAPVSLAKVLDEYLYVRLSMKPAATAD